MRTYYPTTGQETATEAPARGSSRSRSPSPQRGGALSSEALGPASPLTSQALSTVPLSSAAEESFRDEEWEVDPEAVTRLRYVAQAGLAQLADKLRRHQEITQEELIRLAVPDNLPDNEKLVPVYLDSTWIGGVEAAVSRNGGAQGAARSLIAGRDRAEVDTNGEIISAKEWRALARESDGVLKPYLLAFVAFTALGSGTLLTTAKDGSRRFLLLLLVPHVGPELFLVTYLLFGKFAPATPAAAEWRGVGPRPGPASKDPRWKPRLGARLAYLLSFLVVALAPERPDGLAGPISVGVHVVMAALGDAICFWLGLALCTQCLEVASRRLGAALVAHGLAGQLAILEFLRPSLFGGEGMEELRGWGWTLTTLATALSLYMMVPIFGARRLDMRFVRPSTAAAGAICGLAFASAACAPLLAWSLPDVMRQPSFLPRGGLLVIYKVVSSVGGMVLTLYAVNEYNNQRQRPLTPALATFVGSTIWRSLQWVE